MTKRLPKSHELFERALARIPWGTQTNAKRPDEALDDFQPRFIEKADGCRVCDVDGNWYIDFRSALGPIILGYRRPEVDDAVRHQMEKGVLFSMASPIEIEVAERLCDMVLGLEKVRFLKTGSEVNNAALRIARAYTGRDKIVTCGYHGHADWFACGDGPEPAWFPREGNGVPRALDKLAYRVDYGDIDRLRMVFDEAGDELAAMIMVAYDWRDEVADEFVRLARQLTEEHGTVLIFDQVLTGFRLATGGAQQYFRVIPDLTTYAKSIANGYPLAAYGGRAAIMDKLDDVLLTSTYAGETLSLAASNETLRIIAEDRVVDHIWDMGAHLQVGFNQLAEDLGLDAASIGLPPAPRFRFSHDPEVDTSTRTHFFKGLYSRGVFAADPFLISFSHKPSDIDETLGAMKASLEDVAAEVAS
jgi:glutamate-1-semialdehyde aminotransferase